MIYLPHWLSKDVISAQSRRCLRRVTIFSDNWLSAIAGDATFALAVLSLVLLLSLLLMLSGNWFCFLMPCCCPWLCGVFCRCCCCLCWCCWLFVYLFICLFVAAAVVVVIVLRLCVCVCVNMCVSVVGCVCTIAHTHNVYILNSQSIFFVSKL